MSAIARIKKRAEARKVAKDSLGDFARSYNGLQTRIYGKLYGILGAVGVIPGFTATGIGMALKPGDENLGLLLMILGMGWGLSSMLIGIEISTWPNRKLRSVSEEFYRAAGIDVNPGFTEALAPGRTVASFDHRFPDGRSGHVDVICNDEGYPLIFFTESTASVVLEAPKLEALSVAASKQQLAIGATV